MRIRSRQVDEIMQTVEDGNLSTVEALTIKDFTLDAAIEMACCRWTWEVSKNGAAVKLFDTWTDSHPLLDRAWRALRHRQSETHDSTPKAELAPVPTKADALTLDWMDFYERFRRSLRIHGEFQPKLAAGISGALEEMVNNVIEHSGADAQYPALGIVGYNVTKRRMTFSVGDVGRGVLASLRTDPRWASLTNSLDALVAAIYKRATRKYWNVQGDGFLQVLKSLADLNGTLRFRSGDGILTLDGRGDSRKRVKCRSAFIAGFQLSVSCALD